MTKISIWLFKSILSINIQISEKSVQSRIIIIQMSYRRVFVKFQLFQDAFY